MLVDHHIAAAASFDPNNVCCSLLFFVDIQWCSGHTFLSSHPLALNSSWTVHVPTDKQGDRRKQSNLSE
jgi:hypothetical protein